MKEQNKTLNGLFAVATQTPGTKEGIMSEIIKWKFDGIYNADPVKCKQEIESIGSDVRPQQIVDYAKNPKAELHKCFTWNNDVAAKKWRLQEARQVVCNLVIVETNSDGEENMQIRVFHRTDNDEGYKPIQLILKNKDEYEKILERCLSDLRALKNKYKNLSEYQEIWDLIH